ncbi:hypothetical protein MMC13_001248 [Lambiella insularis]|nr:hypothetical protein [Lambiella insularis]
MAAPPNGAETIFRDEKVNLAGAGEVSAAHHEVIHRDPDDEIVPHVHAETILVVVVGHTLVAGEASIEDLTDSFSQAVVISNAALTAQLVCTGAFPSAVSAVVGGADIQGWLLTTITILLVALSPPISQAADYWGRKWLLVVLNMVGCIGCLVTSRANSMGMAIAGEAIVGLCFSITPLLFAVPSEVLPHRHRVTAQGWVNFGSAVGGFVALLVGAALITSNGPEGFRILWYINAAAFALSALLFLFLYRPPPRELQLSLTFKEKLGQLDWIGFGLIVSGLTLFVMGLSWALNPYPWNDAHVLAPLIVGVTIMIALGVYEWKFKVDGMFHHGLFSRDRNFGIALGCVFFEGFVFIAANLFYPYQVAVLYEKRQIIISTEFSVVFFVAAVAGPLAGYFVYKTKILRTPILVAFVSFLIYNICMATTTVGSQKAVWVYPIFLGFGLGVVLSGIVAVAQLSSPPELISITSGLMASVRALGVTVGAAIYTAIFHSKLSSNIPNKIAAAALPLGLPASSLPALIEDLVAQKTELMPKIPGISLKIIGASMDALLDAYCDSFRYVWIVAACFTLAGLIGACFLTDPSKDLTFRIDAPAESEEALYGTK